MLPIVQLHPLWPGDAHGFQNGSEDGVARADELEAVFVHAALVDDATRIIER
ncbi:MAG: hypothetical protein HZB10_03455, partial [Candidatus Yonathbacteria bacterium]|nr:hypothetical protein [Candidatus Yonathbacteria bacterium]